jgi:hypothetical protein
MTEEPPGWIDENPNRTRLFALILAVAAASLAYRIFTAAHLEHTALVFVGIPTILAMAVAAADPAESTGGTIFRATTIAMLLAGIVFGEAFICILMASPLIYLMGFVVGSTIDSAVKWRARRRGGFAHAPLLVVLVAAIPALEGAVPRLEFPREAEVTAMRIVPASPAEVERALARPMRFDRTLPPFLRLGFPTPGATDGTGLRVGDRRAVTFAHGHHPGRLVMEVHAAAPGRIDFAPVEDGSYLVHWLTWRAAEVRLRAVPGGTEVRWTLRYRRRLDPAWYFAPLERYGVGLAAGYLIDNQATPRAEG